MAVAPLPPLRQLDRIFSIMACVGNARSALLLASARQVMQSLHSCVALLPVLEFRLRTAVCSMPHIAVTGLPALMGHTQAMQLQTPQAGTQTLLRCHQHAPGFASSVLCSTELLSQCCLQQHSTTLKML